jgi:hypothetical protein
MPVMSNKRVRVGLVTLVSLQPQAHSYLERGLDILVSLGSKTHPDLEWGWIPWLAWGPKPTLTYRGVAYPGQLRAQNPL